MTDVSRETAALQMRYRSYPGLAVYADILTSRGVERGLIGPREVTRIWPRHIGNCAVVAQEEDEALPGGARIADVGSGAGLPGIVWALVRPDLTITLIEPLLRRATFLGEVIEELELGDRVQVNRSRAEQTRGAYDAVTARAVARLPRLLQWTLPLARDGGWVLALKGSSAQVELDEARPVLADLGGARADVRTYGQGLLAEPTTAVRVRRNG